MRLSMIARIIKAEVCVICRSRRLRRITQTEALIILAIMRKPNPIIVLLCIYLSKCSMCSLNKKYHPLFELLHKTAFLSYTITESGSQQSLKFFNFQKVTFRIFFSNFSVVLNKSCGNSSFEKLRSTCAQSYRMRICWTPVRISIVSVVP